MKHGETFYISTPGGAVKMSPDREDYDHYFNMYNKHPVTGTTTPAEAATLLFNQTKSHGGD